MNLLTLLIWLVCLFVCFPVSFLEKEVVDIKMKAKTAECPSRIQTLGNVRLKIAFVI